MPTEIIEQDYHPYNHGYGKCSHSGYHSIDIVPWLIRSAENNDKYIDNVDIFTNFITPVDFIHQLNISDYKKLFKNFGAYNKYSEKEFVELIQGKRKKITFDFFDHKDSAMLLYGIYKLAALRKLGQNPLVNIEFKK